MRYGSALVRRQRCVRGFTLVEIMVVVVIISLLVALAIPVVRKMQATTQAKTVANDLRVFAGVFHAYNSQNATWPAEKAAGVFPPEMDKLIKNVDWIRVTPIGGSYNWDNAQTHAGTKYTAAIAINSVTGRAITAPQSTWLLIDKQIDDGNLATGSFFLGAGSQPVYIIQK